MKTSCPRDEHFRFLVDGKRLNCPVKDCQCEECHKGLSEEEKKGWIGAGADT